MVPYLQSTEQGGTMLTASKDDSGTPAAAIDVDETLRFGEGDRAIYPAQGVTVVTGIDRKSISGNLVTFYVLKVIDTDKRILIPVNKVESVGLREVIPQDEVPQVFDLLRQRDVPIDTQTWNRRYRGYIDKIKTGSVYEVAEVLRDLYFLKLTKTLSFGERKMLDMAKRLLLQELAVSQGVDEVEVEAEIERLFAE